MHKYYLVLTLVLLFVIFISCVNRNDGDNSDDNDFLDTSGAHISNNYCGESDIVYSCNQIGIIAKKEIDEKICSMTGRSKEEVYFGGSFSYQIIKYDGHSFSRMDIPIEGVGHFWGDSNSGIYGSDGSSIIKLENGEWTIVTEGPEEDIYFFWNHCGKSSDNIYAFGEKEINEWEDEPVIMHFDGVQWDNVELPEFDYDWDLWEGFCASNDELFILIFIPNASGDMMPGKSRIYHYDGEVWALTKGWEYAEQFLEYDKQVYAIDSYYGLFQYKNSKWSVTSSVPAFFKYLKGNAKGIFITGSMPLYPSPHDDIAIYHYDGDCIKRLITDKVVRNEKGSYDVWLSQDSHLFIANYDYVNYLKYDIWECNFE